MALWRKRFLCVMTASGLLISAAPTRAMAEEAEASVPQDSWLNTQLATYLLSVQHPASGLPPSFTKSIEPRLDRIAFTYDVAVSALVLAHAGQFHAAKRALKTYLRMPLPSRDSLDFNTAYLIDSQTPALESRVDGGPIFWLAISLMRTGEAVGDPEAQGKGLALLQWACANLPHHEGGVAMSHKGGPWERVMSVENNWVYYGALRIATPLLPEGPTRQTLLRERAGVRRWLAAHEKDRGGNGDHVRALDVYTHALLVGPESYLEDGMVSDARSLATWARAHIAGLEEHFLVPHTALYDYTDDQEARAAHRPRYGWLEGTEQVSVAYQTWAPWFERQGDPAFAKELRMKAALSHAEVLRYALRQANWVAIPNTNAVFPFRTFHDGWDARPSTEPALNGTNWTYLAEAGYNPFTMALPRRKR